jgi:type III restriction enzyme
MMSFRKAADHTLIAQLVGRMVRSPLARRIEASETLNSVPLFLPHYDASGLKAIIEKLRAPDPEVGIGVEVEDGRSIVVCSRDSAKIDLFAKAEQSPSYAIERITRMSNTRRLLKLARQLTAFDKLDESALRAAKDLVVEAISTEVSRLRGESWFQAAVSGSSEIPVREATVEYGAWKEPADARSVTIPATAENIEDLFERCERVLGEGLKDEYWKRKADANAPLKAKVELFLVLQNKAAWQRIEQNCEARIDKLFDAQADEIAALKASRREVYRRIRRRALTPSAETLVLPEAIEVRRESRNWTGHLYVNEMGSFAWDANSWESRVLEGELARSDFKGWLRIIPRREWALSIPYISAGEEKPLYPDLLIFRSEKGKIRVDLLDPHSAALADAPDKAVGLAKYAAKHGQSYGRIQLIRVERDQILRLELQKEAVRTRVMAVKTKEHLDLLFADLGT